MNIELLPEAEADLKTGAQFYEAQQSGLGNYFIDSLLADIESLHIHAGIHAQHFGYHRLLAKRFPFAVYYKVTPQETVQIYAVLDCRQQPNRTIESLKK